MLSVLSVALYIPITHRSYTSLLIQFERKLAGKKGDKQSTEIQGNGLQERRRQTIREIEVTNIEQLSIP